MKNILLLVMLVGLSACGKVASNTASSMAACQNLISTGTWFNPLKGDTMVLNAACAGTTTYCNEKFTYQIQSDNVTVVASVTQTAGGPECRAMGTNICTINFASNNTLLQINCGFGVAQYSRQ